MDTDNIVDYLPTARENINYWLLRTNGGEYYSTFKDNNFIAIGWNEIPVLDLKQIHDNPDDKALFNKIAKKIIYEGDKSEELYQTKSLNQLQRFVYEVKKGDIVIIPAENSFYLSVGEVVETPVKIVEDNLCSFRKRKSIRWIKKDINRLEKTYKGFRFLKSQLTLNNITEYSTDINIMLYDFYIDQGVSNLILTVKKDSQIGAFELGELYSDILDVIKDFSEFCGESEEDIKNTTVKIQLSSPGVLILTSVLVGAFIVLGIATILAGGESEFNCRLFKFKTKSGSILDKITAYQNSKLERKIKYQKLVERMKGFEFAPNQTLKNIMQDTEPLELNQNDNQENDM